MAIKSGRYGSVKWDADGTTPVALISINAWSGEFKTEYEDVSCYGDVNRVYCPGMRDSSGNIGGFFNAAELALFEAAEQDTPGMLELAPNNTDPVKWAGLAYIDASIDCTMQVPKVTGSWKAAGPFLLTTTP